MILRVLLFCALSLSALAQPYINTNWGSVSPGQWVSVLPNTLSGSNYITYNPTASQLQSAGWLAIGYTQSPSNGWGVLGNYAISPTSNGYCSLLITNQYNLQAAADAAMTNSSSWTGSFITNMQVFRSTLRLFGTTETNAVVNADTMSTWLAAYAKTNTITSQLTAQFIFMGQMYPQILRWSDTTANFPWRLIP